MKQRPAARPRLLVEELERRILYSADAAALLGLSGAVQGAEVRLLEPLTAAAPVATDTAPAQQSPAREIVFIDSRVPDAMKLADELMAQRGGDRVFDIVVLDATEDGITQINRVLANEHDLAAIHIISHGGAGAVVIGSTFLDAARLAVDAESVARWGQALGADGDLLLYGCDVAQDAAGQAFVQSLASVTGADVAASADKTGSASIGGNWTLEFATGTIHTQLTPTAFDRLQWEGAFATYTVTNTNDAGVGSLRQAIIDANANAGADLISFNIAGTGVHTIAPTAALPTIQGQVTIDGTTDDSFAANSNRPAIILAGSNALTNALVLTSTADGSVIRGLVIRDFGGDAISIQAGSDNNVIVGNYIGRLTATGTDAGAGWENAGAGIYVAGSNNTIGGTTAADRNVISGNVDGVRLTGASANTNTVLNNYIGVDVTGAAAIVNTGRGVYIDGGSSGNIIGQAGYGNVVSGSGNIGVHLVGGTGNVFKGNTIGLNAAGTAAISNGAFGLAIDGGASGTFVGGTGAGDGNVISGNTGSTGSVAGGGIYIQASNSTIQGNIIGLNASGTTLIANGRAVTNNAGIYLFTGSTNNLIGGTAANAGNTIAGNTGDGIMSLFSGASVFTALGNRIYSNSEEGIDLTEGSAAVNDAGDADTGVNNLQNFSVLTSANSNAAGTTIVGTINSNANTTLRIEFFGNRPTVADAPNGEGERYLGFITVTTDGSGNASVNTTLASVWVNSGDRITATATVDLGGGNYGGTSEFAANVTATSTGIIVVDTTSAVSDGTTSSITNLGNARGADGRISLLEAVTAANNTANGGTPDKIVFAIPVTDANHVYYRDNAVVGTFSTAVATTLADGSISDFDADYAAGTARSWYRITLGASDLNVTQAVVIDGSTQAGYDAAKGPIIEIKGGAVTAGDPNAITLTTGASTIRGLVINGAVDNAIEVDVNADASVIVGNYFGTDVSGTKAVGNSASWGAIAVKATGVIVGGTTVADRNLISGNTTHGIELYNSADLAVIQGNYIGTTVTGSGALGNGTAGIYLRDSAANNTIGGVGANEGNVIANNGGDGIWADATAGTGNRFLGNLIHSSTGLGIDLGANGVTANDSGDGDTGANNLQNFPVLATARTDVASQLILTGTLNSTANSYYRIEFFANTSQDGTGYGEGRTYLGFANVATDVSGNATISTTLTANVALGTFISATATKSNITYTTFTDTSELARNIAAVSSTQAVVTVDTTADTSDGDTSSLSTLLANKGADGFISLREAMIAANNTAGADTIRFNIGGAGVQTINLTALLPAITDNVLIDGWSQPLFAGTPLIRIDGAGAPNGAGLSFGNTSDGSTVRGLMITGFKGVHGSGAEGDGILVQAGADNITIAGNWIGTTGTSSTGVGNADEGIDIRGSGAIIGGTGVNDRNVITNSGDEGINIQGAGVTNHLIQGNYIGVDPDGSTGGGNVDVGIAIISGSGNTIGGTTAAARNVISRNNEGMEINTSDNVVQGNYIGTDVTGTQPRGNRIGSGVQLQGSSTNNQVGGTAAGAGNLIAFNAANGVDVVNGSGDLILGNTIYSNTLLGINLGTAGVTGNDALDVDTGANNLQNFPVLTSANSNATGTTIVGTINSNANTTLRIEFFGNRPTVADAPNGEGERFLGFITVTTDGSGNASVNTTLATVWVNSGDRITATATVQTAGPTYGSTSEFAANVTATVTGIIVVDTTSDVADGTTTSITNLGNARGADGRISLREAIIAANNTANAGTSDRIVFAIPAALSGGVHTINVGATGLPTITQAVIIDGTTEPDYAGTPMIELNGGNLGTLIKGVTLGAGSDGSTISGLIINRFTGTGIEISGSNNHTIQGNWIGLDATGTVAAANGVKGIYGLNSTGNLIGGTMAAQRNVISGNAQQGIYFDNVDSSTISGNYIGTNVSGTGDVTGTSANTLQTGVMLVNGSSGNVIGGTSAAARNVISGNNHYGFEVLGATSQNNLVRGNYIGTTATGLAALGNTNGGASFWGAGTGNILGGGSAGARNVIAGNYGLGVLVGSASTGATIQGNYIGIGVDGLTVLGNGSNGISVEGASTNTLIGTDANGTSDAAEQNVIAGNLRGVYVTDAGTTGTVIAGNIIGLAADGNTIVANTGQGISVVSGAGSVTIGGATSASRNVISGNASFGIYLGSTTSGSSVLSNYIGTNAAGTSARGNLDGVWIDGSANNIIGQVGAGNVISGSTYYGVTVDQAAATGNVIRANLIGLDATGTANLGNGAQGIQVTNGASTTSIGGTTAGQGNTVAFNAGDGIYVAAGTGNSILGNSIHSNVDQGIDLGTTGVTSNDALDADTGANNLQNFPVLTTARTDGAGQLILTGTLNSTASTQVRIEFFASTAQDGTGYGEGQRYLGFANVTTDASGNASISTTLTATVAAGEFISATASKSNAGFTVFTDTSEFAQNVVATAAPVVTTTGSTLAYTENGAATAVDSGLTVSDADSTNLTGATVTISANYANGQDVLAFTNQLGITGSWNAGTGVLTLSGTTTVANYQTALRAVTYVNSSDNPSTTARTVSFVVNDGSANSNIGTRNISVTAVNDAPVLSFGEGNKSFTEAGPAVMIDAAATVSDVDSANFDTGSLTFTLSANGSVDDRIELLNTGMGAGQIGVSDVNVFYGGVLIGTQGGGIGTSPFVVTFNASADATVVREVMRNVRFWVAGSAPSTLPRTVDVVLTDGDGATAATASKQIAVVAVNDAPTATNLNAAEAYTEDTALNLTDIVISDVDSASVTATLTLSNIAAGALNTGTSGAVTSTYNAGTGVWTASGAIANVNTLLAALTFTPTLNFNSNFTIATSVSDGVAAPITGTKSFTGTAVNDAPTATNLSAAEAYTEDTALNLTDIVISDVDSATVTATLTLSNIAAGSLNTGTSGAVSSTYNAGSGVWTASGAIADVNTLLAGLAFTPTSNFNSSFTIATSVSDGVAAPITGSKSMTGTPVNDAPTGTNLSAAETFTEDTALNLTDIVISDVDSANVTATLTLSNISAGSLNTGTSGAVTSTYNAGTGVWTASGAIADVNVLLAALTFTPTLNFNSNFTVATSVNDGVAAPINSTKSFTGTAVNDAPTTSNLSAAEAYTEDTALNLTDIVISDVDSATVTATLTLSNTAAGSLNTGTSGAVTSTYNAGTGVWTASGAIADVNTLLAALTFTPTLNFNSSFSIATSVSDGVAAPITGSKSMTGTAVNDAPTATNLSAAESYTEDTPLNLVDIVVSDVDSATVTATLTLSNIAAGALNTSTSGAVTSTYNAGTGVWTAGGAIADVNTLLAGLTFTPAGNFNSNFTIATSVSDGVAAAITGTKNFTGTAVNDAPTATNLNAAEAYTEDTALNLTDIVISDVDSANVTATLTLSNIAAGALNTGTSGAVTSTYNAGTGVWTASGAIADVNTLLAGLTFTPTSNFNSSFTIATSVSDGVAAAITGTKNFTGTAVNDAPISTNLSAAEAYTEDTALNLTDIVISDVDSANVTATLTLSNIAAGALNTGTSGAVTSTYNAGTGVWTASGAIADVNVLLAALTFTPTLNFNSNFTVASSVTDGVAAAITGTKALTGTAVNDAPTATITPASYSVNEQATLTLHGTGLSIADVDAGSSAVQATVAVISGTITAAAGTTGVTITNNGTSTVTLSGTLSQINNLLAGSLSGTLTYTIASDTPPASDTLTLTASDLGNTGTGGTLTSADTASINITAVNDAPVATITPATYAATEQVALTLKNSGLAISDVDAAAGAMTVTLSVTEGTLTVTAGGSGALVTNSGTSSVTITGTVTQINNLLGSDATSTVSYIDATDAPSASATLTLLVNDNGNTGGGALTNSDTATINITAINDAPVLAAIGNQSVNEGATLSFTASATDPDLPSQTLTYSLDAASLALGMTINSTTGAFSWTLSEAQGGLAPSVTITVTDNGTGNLTDSETFTVSVGDTNLAPVLAAIGNQSVNEGATLNFTASATDADVPAQALSYSLDAASLALGMTIDANTGAFSWTPSEAQGGLAPSVTITVTDNGTGNLTDSETFTISVGEVNTAPVLAAIGNQSVNEGATLSFTASATDADLPSQTLSYSLDAASLVLGMTINSSTGAVSWTPSETQGGLAPSVTITVTDNGTGNLTDSETFTIAVGDTNLAPVLAVIGNQTVNEGATLNFTASATDADLPSQTLTYSLDAASLALGMTIDANTGAFSWTPSEAQGGLSPSVTITATDNGTGNLPDSETFTITVGDTNLAPVLAVVGNQAVNEGTTLSFTASATDADLPSQTLTYSLDAASLALGMTINSSTGAFSWTPSEAQGGLAPSVTVTVTDNGTGNLTDSETFTITVGDTNLAPVLAAIGNQAVNEGATLSFTALAADADLPSQTLTYSLDAASLALGMTINSTTGALSWTPSEAQGGLAPSVTVTVTDNGTGNLTDSETFTITVNDTNAAPVLAAIGNQSVNEGSTLSFTASAADADLPAQTLSYSLDAASLALGMTIDANTGAFSWTPSGTQGGTTPSVTITVTDNGSGNLTDGETFTISVGEVNTAPVVAAIANQSITEGATLSFTASATDADVPSQTLTYSLDAASLALGMTINSSTGALSWTPSEAQGGLAPSVTITVTDNGTGNLADSETFTITVGDTNLAPVLATIGNQSINEGAALTFTATATDADLPSQTLTYSLDAASLALGMTINSSTGAFSWTPSEAQGGLAPSVTITVTDNGTGNLTDSETFTITVGDTNLAPVLAAIGNHSVNEGATLNFTASATDADLPSQTLTYSLDAASLALGMTIDANTGAFSWTPSEAQGGLAPSVTVTVADNGTGNLTDSETFTITVGDTNLAPVLAAIGDQAVNEGATLSFTASATDADLPSQTLTYSLDAASLALGMTIDANTGAFSWTPSEAQGGLAPSVTITVTDNGAGNLTDSETFTITVGDTNLAPVLAVIGNQAVNEGSTLSFTATAADADLPAQTLTYSLDGASLALGMTINSSTGAFSWTPSEAQGGLSPSVTITATDNGTGNLFDSETFTITVNDTNVAPVLAAIGNQAINEGATLSFTAGATDADLPSQTLTYSLDAASLALGMTINSSTGAFSWTPSEAQGGLAPSVTITVTDNGTGNLADSETFTIAVGDTNLAPVLAVIGNQAVNEGATLSFTASATDADLPSQTLIYSLDAASLALGMTINSSTGTFSWTPSEAHGGLAPSVTITVTDNGTGNLADSETFTIAVGDTNRAPVLAATGNQIVNEGATLSFTTSATDPDLPSQTLTYSLDAASRALGMTINSSTGAFSWTPSEAQGGTAPSVTITVTDNGTGNLTDSETLTITVGDTNLAPVLAAIGNQTVNEGATLTFTASAADADLPSQSLSYSLDAASLALGMTIDSSTGAFSWTPTLAQGGLTPSVTVTVTDNGTGNLTDSETFTITIAAVNDAPVTAPVTMIAIAEDSGARLITQAELLANATDVDGPSLSATGLAIASGTGTLLDNGDGTWTYTPALNDDTSVSFSYTVTDGSLTATGSATLDITQLNDAPVLATASLNLQAGQALVLGSGQLRAVDVDSALSTLVFEVSNVSAGQFELVASPGAAISQFSQAQLAQGDVRFVQTNAAQLPSFDVTVFDGSARSATLSVAASVAQPPTPAPAPAEAPAPAVATPPATSKEASAGAQAPVAVATSDVDNAVQGPAASGARGRVGGGSAEAATSLGLNTTQAAYQAASTTLRGVTLPQPDTRATEQPRLKSFFDFNLTVAFDSYLQQVADSPLLAALQSATVDLRSGLTAEPARGGPDPDAHDDTSPRITVEVAQATGLALSVGAVWWALRAGGLLASLIGTLPTWRHVDLLAVLPDEEDDRNWDADGDDEARRDEQAVDELMAATSEQDS